jgi:hypothetical protein
MKYNNAARLGSCGRRKFAKVLPDVAKIANVKLFIAPLHYYHYISHCPPPPHLFLLMARTACLKASSCFLSPPSSKTAAMVIFLTSTCDWAKDRLVTTITKEMIILILVSLYHWQDTQPSPAAPWPVLSYPCSLCEGCGRGKQVSIFCTAAVGFAQHILMMWS